MNSLFLSNCDLKTHIPFENERFSLMVEPFTPDHLAGSSYYVQGVNSGRLLLIPKAWWGGWGEDLSI